MPEVKLTRREFLKASLGALAAAALPGMSYAGAGTIFPAPGERPNLVYILCDQLRACSVGCYGNAEVSTPHIDQLAAQGARFTNAVSTSPLCTPHRACLITGRYPTVTGVVDNGIKLPQAEVGIAEVMNVGGYHTHYIGKWHLNGPEPRPQVDPGWVAPEDRQGFRQWLAFNLSHLYYGSHYYLNGDPTIRAIPDGVYEPDFQTERAIAFLTANQARRFFLFLSISIPHPGNLPDLPPGGDYSFPYDPDGLTLRPNATCGDPATLRQFHADYYGKISNLDWNVGRVLQALDTLGLANNTVVAFSSDHGDLLGSHCDRGKSRIEAESLDVPFILRYPPAVPAGTVNDVFSSVDIMPTLLGMCGLWAPAGVMGRDFSPLLRGLGTPIEPPWGSVPSTESALVGMFRETNGWVGLRTLEYSLECDRLTLLPTKLFHNALDPYQMTNAVEDPAYEPIKTALYDELLAWLDYVGFGS